jgi:hypothetical protein
VDFAVDDVCNATESSGLAAQPPPPAENSTEEHDNDDHVDTEYGQQCDQHDHRPSQLSVVGWGSTDVPLGLLVDDGIRKGRTPKRSQAD